MGDEMKVKIEVYREYLHLWLSESPQGPGQIEVPSGFWDYLPNGRAVIMRLLNDGELTRKEMKMLWAFLDIPGTPPRRLFPIVRSSELERFLKYHRGVGL